MPFPVVLLHGALGSEADLAPLQQALGTLVPVIALNLSGHGGRPLPTRLSMVEWAADVLTQLDTLGVRRAAFAGYSLGGYLALYLARHHPERVVGVMTLATKVVFDERTGRTLAHLADPLRVASRAPELSTHFAQVHAPQDWTCVAQANRQLFLDLAESPALTDDDLRAIRCPALVVSGAQDQIVSAQETERLAHLLTDGRLLLFRGQAHPLGVVPLQSLEPHLRSWLVEVRAISARAE